MPSCHQRLLEATRPRLSHAQFIIWQSRLFMQTSYQNVSIMLSGNVAQPPVLPAITQIHPITTSNIVALAWSSEAGRVYRVQSENDISSGSWQYATAELSASKTNTAITLPFSNTNNVFYRIVQVR